MTRKEKKAVSDNRKNLMEAIKALNSSGLLGEKIPVVGKGTSTNDLLNNFVGNVNALVKVGKSEEMPDVVIAFYNSLADIVNKDKDTLNLPANKKELRKYVKENKLKIKIEQDDDVKIIQEKIKKEINEMAKKKKEKETLVTVDTSKEAKDPKKETGKKVENKKTIKTRNNDKKTGENGISDIKATAKEKAKVTVKTKSKVEKDKYGFGMGTRCAMIMELAEENKYTAKDIMDRLEGKSKISPSSVFAIIRTDYKAVIGNDKIINIVKK